jgi:hypothetical protein
MNTRDFHGTAAALVAGDKGLLAMKERCPVAYAVINAGINADNDKNGLSPTIAQEVIRA